MKKTKTALVYLRTSHAKATEKEHLQNVQIKLHLLPILIIEL